MANRAAVIAVFLAAVMFVLSTGCGRKAMPEPRNASGSSIDAQRDIAIRG